MSRREEIQAELAAIKARRKEAIQQELEGLQAQKTQTREAKYSTEKEKAKARYKEKYQSPEAIEKAWEERPGLLKARDFLRKAGQGLTLNLSDEVGAGIAGGITALTSDESWGDAYKRIHRDIGKERKQFEKARPKTAMATEIGAGLLGGGLITKAGKKATAKLAAKAPKLAGATRILGEGAVAGAASAEEGNRLAGAGTGAAISGVLGGATKLVGATGRTAKQLVRGQNEGAVKRLDSTISKKRAALADVTSAQKKDVRQLKKLRADAVETGKRQVSADVATAKIAKKQAADLATRQKDAAVKATEERLRKTVGAASPPSAMSPLKADRINRLPTQRGNKLLKKAWTKQGFDMVKKRDFRLDEDVLTDRIKAQADDPAMEDFIPDIMRTIKSKVGDKLRRDPAIDVPVYPGGPTIKKPAPTGTMDGGSLMEARNSLLDSVHPGAVSREDQLRNGAVKNAAKRIDEMIEEQLDGDALNAFKQDKSRYAVWKTREAATQKARQVEGEYRPKDIINAGGTGYQKQFSSRGEAAMQQEAYAANRAAAEADVGLVRTLKALDEQNLPGAAAAHGDEGIRQVKQGFGARLNEVEGSIKPDLMRKNIERLKESRRVLHEADRPLRVISNFGRLTHPVLSAGAREIVVPAVRGGLGRAPAPGKFSNYSGIVADVLRRQYAGEINER